MGGDRVENDRTVREVLTIAKSFDLSPAKHRYQEEQELSREAVDEHFDELLKYLSLCGATEKQYGMRGPIDECWHTLIIFTKLYADICSAIAPSFIHHFPNVELPQRPRYTINPEGLPVPDDGGNVPQLREGYLEFLKDYQIEFGVEPPAHLWPRPVADEVEGYAGVAAGCGCRCIC